MTIEISTFWQGFLVALGGVVCLGLLILAVMMVWLMIALSPPGWWKWWER